jgi:hypothetical protein
MIIGTFSGPPAPDGGSASAVQYSTIQELLYQMPDNTANLIQAKNVRNSIYTLWERISEVQIIASQSASASSVYTNLSPSVASNLVGIPPGSTFSGASMQEMWDKLLYPYVYPYASISGGNTREFGSSNAVTLSWTATKNTKTLTFITLKKNGGSIQNVSVTGNTQTGTFPTTAVTNTNTTFSIDVTDSNTPTPNTVTAYTYVYWDNRRYWGTLPSGHPLTTVSSLTFSHGDITALSNSLDGGLSGNGNYTQTRTITTNFDYVVFIWPSNAVNLSTNPPHVSIGGFGNNNWIKTRSNVAFTNQLGYTGATYDVWVFGNTQAPNTFTYVIT